MMFFLLYAISEESARGRNMVQSYGCGVIVGSVVLDAPCCSWTIANERNLPIVLVHSLRSIGDDAPYEAPCVFRFPVVHIAIFSC